eukprot:SAG22_NODE_167_length_16764_cov_34.845245_8_plen_134_part_00
MGPVGRFRAAAVLVLLTYMAGMAYLFRTEEFMQSGMLSRRTRTLLSVTGHVDAFEEDTATFDEISAELQFALRAAKVVDDHRLHRAEAAVRRQTLGPLRAWPRPSLPHTAAGVPSVLAGSSQPSARLAPCRVL